MKDLFFAEDLLTLFRHDKHYGEQQKLAVALRKFGLAEAAKTENSEKMLHDLVVHIMDQRGETEAFLAGTFIYPEAVVQLLKESGLPAPAALQPESASKSSKDQSIDKAQLEQYFDIVCRNCATVTDPLAKAYRTPLGRLVFRTFWETRQSLGINATGRYVLEHLTKYDTEKTITSVNEDSVTWLTEDSREKLTSVQTIATFVLNFNRELQNLL